mmetsp:Transcript_22175/g.37899  ORF Transcript_22175/g.37899 Transcript_22175/m.37899 type:complete len:334 (+) Transcript_22175:64-1065(+)|eukprot:CAMPEP_0119104242 /NCGR_PEP_ID=MMETSP1180-20130426/2501_1 /TAXON_ID=3052 ORGANISM="Chlamydomonas cf sp, Strain CCMP681" /NCGR_SAMPLE_ID=MMETSP1180 /ASSEMBLY_ACC=CAM_ASM_000741 /LENGTH=333 /DNA_ID=CAMNT_0007088939 /DNA_START=64 /DNA_END=1065 /DNA_ORIENTATION=-
MAGMLGDQISAPPTDTITRLLFSRHSNLLLAASWDSTVRLYHVDSRTNPMISKQRSPVMDVTYPEDNTAYCGLLSGEIRRIMCPSGQDVTMGAHEGAVRCMEWVQSRNFLVSGSWDQTIKVWDPRNPQPLVKSVALPGRVFAMSCAGDRLVVAMSKRLVHIYDARKLEDFGVAEQRRESSLKHMTRCVATYPDGTGYALASVEGRCAMEPLAPEAQAAGGKYAFKCHRTADPLGGPETIYPVHCIAFHPIHGTFATGGGDGVVNIWDGANKKRLFQISRYPTSVASLSFSPDGQYMAVASSYCWEQGDRTDMPPTSIFLRQVAEAEVRPKSRH